MTSPSSTPGAECTPALPTDHPSQDVTENSSDFESLSAACDVVATANDEKWWKAARNAHRSAGGITGTDAGILMAGAFGKSVHDLYAVATGLTVEDDIGEVPRVKWGNLLEPLIMQQACAWSEETATQANLFVRSRQHPHIASTLDGVGIKRDGTPFIVECKSSGAPGWDNGIPEHVAWQVQAQMIATGIDLCLVAVLRFAPGGIDDLYTAWVEADPDAQAELIRSSLAYREMVLSETLPPIDGSEGCSRLLSARYRGPDQAEPIALDGSFIDLDQERETICAAIKAADSRKREIDNQIKAAIGRKTRAVLPNGTRYTWTPSKKSEPDGPRTLRRSGK